MKIIVLAGGIGTRLWPLSRKTFPKQFMSFGRQPSFLQKTLLLFLKAWDVEDIIIMTNQEYLHLVKNQVANIHSKLEQQIITEPETRSTGPAVALAVNYLQEKGCSPKECLLVSSSDHFIFPEEQFINFLKSAEHIAEKQKIVIFGTPPSRPETGYGYIKFQKTTESPAHVEEFIEKPNLTKAEEYFRSGKYLWNCGIFAFQTQTFLTEMEKYNKDIFMWMKKGYHEMLRNFSKMPKISIDHSLIEKSKNVAVIPMNITWSDIGCWDSIYELFLKDLKDLNQNVKIGNVHDIDTKNSLIIGKKRLISTIGIEDMIIVDTEDAVFLGKRGESQKVKQLVETLEKQGKKESLEHPTTHRPWGFYTILEEGPRYKIKKIVVNPGQKISLQYHFYRSEHWVIVNGKGQVTKDEIQQLLSGNESIYIPQRTHHRLENIGEDPLELIEVQIGDYLGEDDIVRLEDVYGRLTQEAYIEV